MEEEITVAQDYNGVFLDDLGETFRRMLRIETRSNLPIDVCKGIGYHLLRMKYLLRVAEKFIDEVKPREEAVKVFQIAQSAGARIVLVTSNPKFNTQDALFKGKPGDDLFQGLDLESPLKVGLAYIKNT